MTSVAESSAPSGLGVARPRIDAANKVTGISAYAADVPIAGLLHGRLVLSEHAHASIISIHTDAALALPGVHAVLLAADLPD